MKYLVLSTAINLAAAVLVVIGLTLATKGIIYRLTWHPVVNAIETINLGDQPETGKIYFGHIEK